jgi:hypothetical protein
MAAKSKYSLLLVAAVAATACDTAPPIAQPPASEFTAAKFELAGPPSTDSVSGAAVTQQFLSALGVRPLLGRLFIAGDFQSDGAPATLISYELWQRRFGGDATIIGRTIQLNGKPAVVVAVLPKEVDVPKGTAIWVARR